MTDLSDAIDVVAPVALATDIEAAQTIIYDMRTSEQQNDLVQTTTLKKILAPLRNTLQAFAVFQSLLMVEEPSRLLVASRHYHPDVRLLRGITLELPGFTPIVAENAHLFVNDRLGMGVTAYLVADDDSNTTASLRALFTRLEDYDALPELSAVSQLHRITIAKLSRLNKNDDDGGGDVEKERFAIVVRANATSAAVSLMEMVAMAPFTLKQLVDSVQYKTLIAQSQHVRDTLAKQMAKSLGLKLDDGAPLVANALIYFIAPVDEHSETVRVFHETYDASESNQSNILVEAGECQLLLKLAAQPRIGTKGNLFSTPAIQGKRTRETATVAPVPLYYHRSNVTGLEPPYVETLISEREHSFTATRCDTKLDFIAGVAASLTTLHYPSIEELFHLALRTRMKAIPVPCDHAVVGIIATSWDLLKPHLPIDYTLHGSLASEYSVEIDPIFTDGAPHTLPRDYGGEELLFEALEAGSSSIKTRKKPIFSFCGPTAAIRGRFKHGHQTVLAIDRTILAKISLIPWILREKEKSRFKDPTANEYPSPYPAYYFYYDSENKDANTFDDAIDKTTQASNLDKESSSATIATNKDDETNQTDVDEISSKLLDDASSTTATITDTSVSPPPSSLSPPPPPLSPPPQQQQQQQQQQLSPPPPPSSPPLPPSI